MKNYLVKPGYIRSRSDGDEHYISFHQLCDLYGVSPAECLNLEMADMHGYSPDYFKNTPVLTPRFDGKYELPAVGERAVGQDTPKEIAQPTIKQKGDL